MYKQLKYNIYLPEKQSPDAYTLISAESTVENLPFFQNAHF